MSSAYIQSLKLTELEREVESQQAPNLSERFQSWFDNLPEVSRVRLFSMLEMEQALETQGKYLSPILLSKGWQRRRRWSSLGQYHRYWLPPELAAK